MGALITTKQGVEKMDRQVLLRKIMDTGDEVRRLEQDLIALQSIDIVGYPENYSNLSKQAVTKGEFIARKLRELVYSTTNLSWSDLLQDSVDTLGVAVDYSGGVVSITVPCLIPGRKKKPIELITAPLYTALERFIVERLRDKPFERFTDCVICITHVYDKALFGKGRKRDHDNIEIKGIIDVINTFLLTDDNGFLCSIYSTSEFSQVDCTRISIMEKDMFSDWLLDMKKG